MLRHPLVALIHRSRHYRVLIGGFVLRMTGAYTATLAAVWGAWKYGSPARAAWLVAIISVASALGALWVGHRHDRGAAQPVLRAAGAVEAVACTVLALAGTRAVPDVVLLGAGAAAGISRAVWSAAVTPALADAAEDDRAVGAFGVGWAFDVGKLAGAVLVAAVLWTPFAILLVPALIVVGTVMFTRFRIDAPNPVAAPDRPVVARADVGRAIAMLAIAAFVLYQQDLLFRVAIDTPGMYAVAAGAFAVGAIAATAGLLLATGIVAATFGLVIGWGCAYGIQGCRPLFAWAPRPGAASGLSIALMTVATATGAPVVVELLGHLGPAVVLIGGSLILGAVFSPDVHGAAGAAATATATGSGSGSGSGRS